MIARYVRFGVAGRGVDIGETHQQRRHVMKRIASLAAVAVAGILAGCAIAPTGPSVLALPGTGRSFEDFRASDAQCRAYAWQQIGGMTQQADPGVRDAVIGTAVGAAAGAAMGGHQGAGIGAGAGLLLGSAVGAGDSRRYGYDAQERYDMAYIQCMYANRHRVPVPASMAQILREPAPPAVSAPTRAAGSIPPPPKGQPPASLD